MPTIRDVAREAGVAASTVSRVFNDVDSVAPATRSRVLEVAQRLNYRPDFPPKTLPAPDTKTLAFLVPDMLNPFFPTAARGLSDAVGTEGYGLILCSSDGEWARMLRYEALLRESLVQGVVVCGSVGTGKQLIELIPRGMPIVAVDSRLPGLGADSVEADNRVGGKLAVQHLMATGCRHILHLGGPVGVPTADQRLRGYVDALGELYREDLVLRGAFDTDSGYTRVGEAIQRRLNFDGIFAANDLLALGALRALSGAGVRVPEQVAVIGFDDIYMAPLASPPLSTIAQPTYRLGALAGRLLLDRLRARDERRPAPEPRHIVLDPVLRIRQSSKREFGHR